MDQFRNLFNSCRIPLVNKDRLDFHFKTVSQSAECPTHLIVIYKYRFFKMNITHENKLLSITEFYNQIETINGKSNNIGTYEVFFGDYKKMFDAPSAFNKVTVDDIKNVAKKYFKKTNRTVGILKANTEE